MSGGSILGWGVLFWEKGRIAWRVRLFRCVDTYVSEWEILILKSEGDLLYDAKACVFEATLQIRCAVVSNHTAAQQHTSPAISVLSADFF